MTRIVARNRYIASTVLILGGLVAAANAASGGPVPTVTPTPASFWGVNAKFSASGQNYLLVTSDTYNDYYVQSTSSGGYQWSYSKSGSWSNVPSQHISSTLSSQLAAYFGGGADDPPTPPPTTPTPPPSTPTPPAASVPTVTPTPASFWGVNAKFSASGQNYLLVTSDTYNDYYVRSTSAGGYQWSYSKSGSWSNIASQYISSTLSSQLAAYFGGGADDPPTPPPTPPPSTPTPPPVPNTLTVSPSTSSTGNYTVSWGASSGASTYELQEQDDAETWRTVYTGSLRSASVTTNTNGVYTYRARACKGTTCSAWTATGSVTVSRSGVPAVPSPFTVPSTSTNGVYTLTWGASTGASSYALQERVNGAWSDVILSPVTSTSKAFEKSASGAYGYRVKACNASGCGAWTAVKTVTVTLPPPPLVPGAITGPERSSDGAYTVAWGSSTGATGYELQESRNGAGWSAVPTTGTSKTKAFTGKTSAEYHYRVRACKVSCSDWTAIKMVLVHLPPTVGFDSTYVARTGDLDSNGTDIYLSPLAIGTGNVGEFLLENDSGTFVLVSGSQLSTADLAAAQSWAVSTQLNIVLEDANVDGVWDAFVTGVTGAATTSGFEGAVDQIVISPSTTGGVPTGLIAVDSDLKGFVDSVMAWYKDLAHFDTNVVTQTNAIDQTTSLQQLRAGHLAACQARWGTCSEWVGKLTDYYGTTAACVIALASAGIIPRNSQGNRVSRVFVCESIGWAYFRVLQIGATVKSFNSVEDGAKEDVADFVQIWEAGGTAHQVEDLADVLEALLGITIGGYDYSGIENDDLDEPIEQRIFEVHQSLLNIYALIRAQGRGNLDIPANKVLVTKRRVVLPLLGLDERWSWGIDGADENDWHAALEYPLVETYDALSRNPTIAAYQRSDKLVSKRNQLSERNNLFAGTVTSSVLANMATIWVALADKERNYCNNLDYAYPSLLSAEPDEYNSNGFAAGIIASIVATTDAPIHTFFLGNKPVPSSEFLPSDCE